MSGSPIYVDGKLVGALSRAALWTRTPDKPIGLVTPIELMMNLIERNEGSGGLPQAGEENSKKWDKSLKEGLKNSLPGSLDVEMLSSPPSTGKVKSTEETVFTYPLRSPLMVEGLGDNAYSLLLKGVDFSKQDYVFDPSRLNHLGSFSGGNLSSDLSDLGLDVRRASSSSSSQGEAMELKAGSPVGVALTTGDVSIGSLGTVTYKQDDSVLAFGHRFLMGGSTNYALTRTEIYDTVQGLKSSWKLGSLARTEGKIVQDRTQGIMGVMGEGPNFMDLSVEINQEEKNSNSLQVGLTKENKLIARLTYPVLMESITRTINRVGPGTAKIKYSISGDNLDGKLERTDIFFSTTDVSRLPSLQVASLINTLAYNPFKDPKFSQVEAEIEIMDQIKAGIISYFATNQRVYSPGDSIVYKLRVKNYRDQMTEKTGILKIPEGVEPGNYVLAAYGGPRPGSVAPPQNILSFDQMIKYLETLKSYDHLSVELLRPLSEQVVPMSGSGYRYTSSKRVDHKYKDQFILGRKGISVKVVEKEETKEEEE